MHLASDTISRTAIGRLRAKELPVDPEALIYERMLRFTSPLLPLLAQDCGISHPELSLFVMEGDQSFPNIPPALNSRCGVEPSHDGADARSSSMTVESCLIFAGCWRYSREYPIS
jgi:hypothetical protein